MSKNILIVDDSFVIRAATRHFLEEETDFTVCGEAIDGLDALEKAEQLHPDLIILDLAMPRMDGLQAAVKLGLCPSVRPSSCLLCMLKRCSPLTPWRLASMLSFRNQI